MYKTNIRHDFTLNLEGNVCSEINDMLNIEKYNLTTSLSKLLNFSLNTKNIQVRKMRLKEFKYNLFKLYNWEL